MPEGGALVFPHTRLEATGDMVAAVALAVVRSGCEEVLALGVLHGAWVEDAELVRRAREGDAEARAVEVVDDPDVGAVAVLRGGFRFFF